ncbi:DUF1648 domain-containing protein [Oceanobacillus piezotolerans]|uniref:DUF1648 domain-containing protein n=1 Tax=Oceanobacillus piezotolerans TaxID=2448030 RepID=A0A498D8Z1_9BACI|nr:DUF5808 domain-containing protein [Oceanobacillus piezotolerans]RLL40350.1 DUF1648 domain-containing protein [Oceanobacillus piezotolerans]
MNILLFLVVVFLPIFIMTIFIPYWTRKTESFGITIPEEIYFDDKLRKMRKQYAFTMSFFSILITIVFIFIGISFTNDEQTLSILFAIATAAYLGISFAVYLKFHQNMKALKAKENWNMSKSQQVFVDVRFRNQKLIYSNIWFILPIFIAAFLIFITFQAYQDIPEQIPMQYNFEGEVTNWAEKSHRSVILHPVMMVYLSLIFVLVNISIAKAKQQINPNNPKESIQKNIIFRRRSSGFLLITCFGLTLTFTLIQLSLIYPISSSLITRLPLIIVVIIIGGAIILSVTTGQGGSRLKNHSHESTNITARDDDKYWKLGQFYFNKNDPALFLEKRFGIGWTVNLARPLAWIILLAVIGLAFGIPFLLT